MHEQLVIGFIGGGNMARAIVAGLLRSGHPAAGLKIADPSEAQRTLLAKLAPQIEISADNDSVAAASVDGMMEPEELAQIVVEKLRQESFLMLTHDQVLEYMQRKTSNYDRWIGGMRKLNRRFGTFDS